ncbi:7-carboxy-7-deazaguanine synthase QueE [Amycolatopsis anabasis]|uniref:7-carboxy-7-deazaguanine synthase QueE n=1 Tax=Amycolatopsis anabasis TaxID=1840409 RepID=UPI00131D0EDE|nr:7-carboxy-7-deazaguanine synthase QueE [Amycolatopsis anabasis]
MTGVSAPATADTLVASEVFGPTVQGEGPTAGRRASFVRLGGCNLACSWCDTPYTWDGSRYDLRAELARKPVRDIVDRALVGDPGLVVISGGEPLLHQHQPGWTRLLWALRRAGVDIEIETNGTVAPTPATLNIDLNVRFNVSPKLAHSGDPAERRIRPEVLTALVESARASFKFVCATPADVDEAAELVHRYEMGPGNVWISPEGTSVDTIVGHTKILADRVVEHGFNLGTRLHVLAWGNERGR